MVNSRTTKSNLVRGLAAVLLLAAFAAFVGRNIVPAVPVWMVLAYVLAGGLAACVLLLAAAAASLQFRQVVIRKGGTDTQWFWFSSEPAGLVRLREEAREKAERDRPLEKV